MNPDPQPLQHSGAPSALPAATRLGAVHLTIADLGRSIAWYQDVVGLQVRERTDASASLGAGGEDLVVLHETPSAKPVGRHAGLFHIALLHSSREELGHALKRIAASGAALTGASDHGVSEALYLRDPDHNGVEIYADRTRDQWPAPDPGERVGMFTAPLEVDALLESVARDEPRSRAGAGLTVGHVHLQVGDIEEGLRFYTGALGFELMASWSTAAFVAAGGYHHHLAFNTWQGEGVPPAPPDAAGLRLWTIVLENGEQVAAARLRLREAGVAVNDASGGLLVRDPWGIEVLITA